jgi:hypothetical protein
MLSVIILSGVFLCVMAHFYRQIPKRVIFYNFLLFQLELTIKKILESKSETTTSPSNNRKGQCYKQFTTVIYDSI